MKRFLGFFVFCFLLVTLAAALLGEWLAGNVYVLIGCISLVLALILSGIAALSDEIDTLKKRIEELEKK